VPFASHEMIPDDLYDNLLQLVKIQTTIKIKSKKNNNNKHKKKSKKRT
jgi:hypothetical protein